MFLWFKNMSIGSKLYLVMGIMTFLIAAELYTLYFTIHTLSATRAFVGGEGLYSKAQKEAVYSLLKYAYTYEENDYTTYKLSLLIPAGDREAREALEKAVPRQDLAFIGFLKGRNSPDDIDEMESLFRRFRHVYYIDKAIQIWSKGDSVIEQLNLAGTKLHTLIYHSAHLVPDRKEIDQEISQIDQLNHQLSALEDDFSFTLGQGSRWLENLILKILILVALTVELTGLFLTISISGGINRGLKELMQISSQIGRSDFHVKAHITSGDELGKLAGSFNEMANELEKKQRPRKKARMISGNKRICMKHWWLPKVKWAKAC